MTHRDLAAAEGSEWHVRFFVTSRCNFRCTYCNPAAVRETAPEMTFAEREAVLSAAADAGISRIHWTGGEPTIIDLAAHMRAAMRFGFTEQILTTNGWSLHRILPELIECGLTAVNISLDAVDRERNAALTGGNFHDDVLKSIEAACNLMHGVVKINIVSMRRTLAEVGDFIALAESINTRAKAGRCALKFLEMLPNNPVFRTAPGIELLDTQHVTSHDILDALRPFGPLIPYEVRGDNPNCRYYSLPSGLCVGLITLQDPTDDAVTEGGKKLRVSVYGVLGTCRTDRRIPIRGLDAGQIRTVVSELICDRNALRAADAAVNDHHEDYGFWRWGNTG